MGKKYEQLLEHIPNEINESSVLYLVNNNLINSDYLTVLKKLTNLSDEVISGWLNINVKTFRNYKKVSANLRADIQEHTIMLISLIKYGISVFGDKARFDHWLQTENFLLGKKKPMDYLNTISGIRFIGNRLTGIEYGDNI